MGYNPETRVKALNAAMDICRGVGPWGDVESVLNLARQIEAYLNGDDTTKGGAALGGRSGQILPGQSFTSQSTQGMPQ